MGDCAAMRRTALALSLCLLGCNESTVTPTDASTTADLGADAMTAADVPPSTPGCVTAAGSARTLPNELADGSDRVTVAVTDPDACLRTYTLTTTAPLRDNQPSNPRTVTERTDWPTLRTRNPLLDALYALTVEEVRENSVGEIRDGAFNNGAPLPCPAGGCFETGRLWNYVWTRDTAYSVDLGLAAMDPTRARNSLEFKLSNRRGGGDLQIVQDTGTGGSWPVSTDRAVWSLGGRQLLHWLDGDARTAFRDRAYEALRNTAAMDRAVVFDEPMGVYRGEQSFLDWREQTYAAYTATDTAHIASSVALGTNVAHLTALRTLAAIAAERGDATQATTYAAQADALRDRLRALFWSDALQNFSAFVPTFLDPAPVERLDALATALAVLEGVATPQQARDAIASYPHAGKGLAVIWPQQQLTPIYHNRAMWPFVSAYWLRAARRVRNDRSVTWNVESLVRATALNLSNMENVEFATGRPRVEDGAYSGPVVNSQRQLWSVAAFVSMVHDTLFGIEASPDGLRVRPYIPRQLRATMLRDADSLALNSLRWRGKVVDVVVRLPPVTDDRAGAYALGAVTVDGRPLADGAAITPQSLGEHSRVEVTLVDTPEAASSIRTVDDLSEWRRVFGPRTPTVSVTVDGGMARVAVDVGDERGDVTLRLYRDGARVATLTAGQGSTFNDPVPPSGRVHCYAVDAVFASGAASQRSLPACAWGAGERVVTIAADALTVVGGSLSNDHGRRHVGSWGDPGSRVEATFTPTRTGLHLIQAVYSNGAGGFTTGITCGVKRVEVQEAGGAVVATGVIAMPHTGAWGAWRDSTFVRATLTAGRTYQVVVRDDAAAPNMSVFDHFARYTGGTGGSGGAFNRVNLAAIKLLVID